MKLLDAKPGQKVRRPHWGERYYWHFDEGGMVLDRDGNSPEVLRPDLEADDYVPVETDAEKIARLEATIRRARDLCAEYMEDNPSDSDVFAAAECIAEVLK